mgnify:CR=1 FL=1
MYNQERRCPYITVGNFPFLMQLSHEMALAYNTLRLIIRKKHEISNSCHKYYIIIIFSLLHFRI